MPSQQLIYVVFRGSTSVEDWLYDFDVEKVPYAACDKCEVHKGFYTTEQSVIGDVTLWVTALKQQYPSYGILVTGHSLGTCVCESYQNIF